MLAYALTIFLSAFLLFQVQPIVAKMILPWFGGAAGVWTTCMLFFQLVLVLGYLYAHWAVERPSGKRQAILHTALLLLSLGVLPIIPSDIWKPAGTENPAFRILLLLTATVGLPYFLLSTTGPLFQAWYSRANPDATPYRLYALANLGSMLALLSYPVLAEPLLSTRWQGWGWSIAYAVFVGICISVTLRSRPERTLVSQDNEAIAPGLGVRALWVTLPACGSALLLSVTRHLSQNVAAIPFLWILPLSLYLLTFILCFERESLYPRSVVLRTVAVALGCMAYALSSEFENTTIKVIIPLFSGGLFLGCLFCHGELARLKPHPRFLTSFYLMVALGGALGGVFVGLVAPAVFPAHYELPAGLSLCAVLFLLVQYRDPESRFHRARFQPEWLALVLLCVTLLGTLGYEAYQTQRHARRMVRNFYGELRIEDTGDPSDEHARRKLMNGTINHGEQFLAAARRMQPTTYYGPPAGVGVAILNLRRDSPQRVGVIGLGAGVLASYGRKGDTYRFYEINPLVVKLARSEFTFLSGSPAKLEVVTADARLALEREPSGQFDILVVDAFTSDSIPVHLLTKEAFALMFRHLNANGVLAVHISNRYLNLEPVVERTAFELHKPALLLTSEDDSDKALFGATWVLLSNRPEVLDQPVFQEMGAKLSPKPRLRTWTDDYSNLFQILK